jgi:hypothetical protein
MKSKWVWYLVLLTVGLTTGLGLAQRVLSEPPIQCLSAPPALTNAAPVDRDDVYAAVLEYYRQGSAGIIVVEDTTSAEILFRMIPGCDYSILRLAREFASDFSAQSLESFLDNNTPPGRTEPLPSSFRVRGPYKLVDQDTAKKYRELNDPDISLALHRVFPNSPGILTFSNAGFNKTGDEALLYAEIYSGSLNAEGTYFVLSRETGVWSIKKAYRRWVS